MRLLKKNTGIIFAAALVLAFVIYQVQSGYTPPKKGTNQISYIYRNHSFMGESQQSLRQGIERVARENHCEITSVPYDEAISAEFLETIMIKEWERGADALLIEAASDTAIQNVIRSMEKKLPVVKMDDQQNKCIDFRQMGRAMAEKAIKEKAPDENIYIIPGDERFEDIFLAVQGAREAFEDSGEPYALTNIFDLNVQEKQIILTFDLTALETCAKIKKEQNTLQNCRIYGFGNTNLMISYLEEGYIEALGVFDEYCMGYVAAGHLVKQLNPEDSRMLKLYDSYPQIHYSIIGKDQIYTTENQRLLFPFVH